MREHQHHGHALRLGGLRLVRRLGQEGHVLGLLANLVQDLLERGRLGQWANVGVKVALYEQVKIAVIGARQEALGRLAPAIAQHVQLDVLIAAPLLYLNGHIGVDGRLQAATFIAIEPHVESMWRWGERNGNEKFRKDRKTYLSRVMALFSILLSLQ